MVVSWRIRIPPIMPSLTYVLRITNPQLYYAGLQIRRDGT